VKMGRRTYLLGLLALLFISSKWTAILFEFFRMNVEISLVAGSAQNSMRLDCQVVRVIDDGVGFRILSLDADSFGHLRNVVAYNEESLEVAKEDFRHFLEQKLKKEKLLLKDEAYAEILKYKKEHNL